MSALVTIDWPRAAIAVVTLNRPTVKNALSMALRSELVAAIEKLTRDGGQARVLILTGAGNAFCAGLDLKELGGDTAALMSIGDNDPVAAIAGCRQPVIAAINGACVTGGFELALACDLRIASNAARFADTHAQVGVMPGWGLSQRLSRLVGLGRAKELSFTSRFLGAEEAASWGLVNEVVPSGRLLDRAIELAEAMLRAAPTMLERYKSIIDDGFAMPLQSALAEEVARAQSFNAQVGAEAIDARREAITIRGREAAS